MTTRISASLVLILLFTAGCSHIDSALKTLGLESQPPTPAELVSMGYEGKIFELKHSHFYGELYDENEFMLLAPYPFRDVFHLVDLEGQPIHPQNQRGVIPAGTRVRFRELDTVDRWSSLNRMLTAPRYHSWLIVELVDRLDLLPSERQPFVLLVSAELDDPEVRKAAIDRWLAPVGETTSWLQTRSSRAQQAIALKAPYPGMQQDELIAAMGPPKAWIAEQGQKGQQMVAWYPHAEAWMDGSLVVSLQQQRPLASQQPPR